MHPMLNIAIEAARSASKIIVRYADKIDTLDITEKGRNNFVSQVDHLAEQEIISIIRKAYPHHAFLAEESGESGEQNDYCWIIDPLDGTTNYLHGVPHYAISIALQMKGRLEIAVIYDPMRQELFTATRGKGAQLNHRRIRVSDCKKTQYALLGTGFPFRNVQQLPHYLKTFQAVFPVTAGIRRSGSAALDLAYLAAGRLDGFWEAGLAIWDLAAGCLIIKEAGGMLSDFLGADDYLKTGNVIAGNPRVFKDLVKIIHKSLEE